MNFYGMSKKDIDSMSLWYIDRFIENIGNITSWKNGGQKLQPIGMIQKLVIEQGFNKESY